MNCPPERIAALIVELTTVLDEEIGLLERRSAELADLAEATLQRDDDRLEVLLDEVERTLEVQNATDLKLQALRNALADALGWPVSQMRLSRLIEELPGGLAGEISYRREQILLLSGRLKDQHLRTALVVSECARINKLLLESFFPDGGGVTTYNSSGASSWGPESGRVDVES